MKLRKCIAMLAACLMLCGMLPLGVSAAADLNPLKNGGFENGFDSWEALSTSGVKVTSTAAYEGRYGCHLTGDGDWDEMLCQTFSVLPGYTYTLTFWYKAQPMGVSWALWDDGLDGVRICRGWAGQTVWTQVTRVFIPASDTVTLLFKGSGSHVAESVYLDAVTVRLMPCDEHTYDNDCDTQCNVCDEERQVGDHIYEHDCDTQCNSCGFERPASGKHTYDFPCATLCNYCGAPRVSEGEHTYDDVCDVECDFCGEIREVPHFYDDIYDPDCSHCGHVRVPEPKPMERLSYGGAACSEDVSGVAFRFFLEAANARIRANNTYVEKSGTVCRYNNGVEYKLIRVGAVMSNEKNPILDLDHLTARTINIHAGYLCSVTEDSISFAVRIINIPAVGKNTTIYARPYYIYSDGKEEIVVYGDTFTQTYNNLAGQL